VAIVNIPGGGLVANPVQEAEDFLHNFGHTVGTVFVDLLSLIGLGLGGGQAAAAPTLTDLQQDAFRTDPSRAITPAEVAAARVKNQMSEGDAQHEASLSGINAARLDMLIAIAGNPPGPETLLQMLRRGVINEGDATQGMREGYLRNEWIPQLLALQDVIMSPPEAVNAVVQGHLDYGDGQRLAALSGIGAGTFDVMFETAGNPPGNIETLTLWNRGIIDEATAVQALKESRLKDKYIPAVLQLARRRLPLRNITQLLNAGAISDADALDALRALGYSERDAELVIAGHKAPPKDAVRHLTVAQIKALLDAGSLSQAEAATDLQTLGYSSADAAAVVSLMVVPPERKIRQAAITRIRSRYDAHKITRTEASNALDALQTDPTQRDQLLAVWDIEQTASAPDLTVAELTRAANTNAITLAECRARIGAKGYDAHDTEVLLMIHNVIPTPSGGA
jgi:hypothetical protein